MKWYKNYRKITFNDKPILGLLPTINPEVLQVHKKDQVILYNFTKLEELVFAEYVDENDSPDNFIETGYKSQHVGSTYHVPRTTSTVGQSKIDFLVDRFNDSAHASIYRQFSLLDLAVLKQAHHVIQNKGEVREFIVENLAVETLFGNFAGRSLFHIFQNIEAVKGIKELIDSEDKTT